MPYLVYEYLEYCFLLYRTSKTMSASLLHGLVQTFFQEVLARLMALCQPSRPPSGMAHNEHRDMRAHLHVSSTSLSLAFLQFHGRACSPKTMLAQTNLQRA